MRKFSHPPNLIVLHHAAALSSSLLPPNDPLHTIRVWHAERGFADIGYHAVTHGDRWYLGRNCDYVGAHCYGLNKRSLGICCFADLTREPLTSDMITSVCQVVEFFRSEFGWLPVVGHNNVAATLCPGPDLVQAVNRQLESRNFGTLLS